MPNRLLPMMTANHLKVIHELAESGAEPPTAQEASDESRSKVESNWDERARHATIHVSESGIVLSNFGFPVTSKFGIQIGVNQKTWLGDTGVFFGFRSRRVASANMHSFQSIELVKIPETTPSFRILWSRYNVRQQLRAKATIETSRGFLHATQLPLADIEISEPDHRVQRLCVFVGETGMPQVSLNDNQLINWKLSFAGRKYVGMNPERLNSHMQGRIGTIARRGTTLFSNPQLKYLT
jgi:hypothetical protein